MNIIIKARGIIIHEGRLLVFQLRPNSNVRSLPGGRIDFGESLEQCLIREIKEETGVAPELGKFLIVHQFVCGDKSEHLIEFFFYISNSSDYFNADFSGASHGHEILSHEFIEPNDTRYEILPAFMRDVAKELIANGPEHFTTRLLHGDDEKQKNCEVK